MYIGSDLPDVTPGDIRSVTLDFVNDIGDAETIVSASAFVEIPTDLNIGAPVDSNPQGHLTSGPTVTGSQVTVQLTDLISGIIYRVRIIANTDRTNGPELYTHIRCTDAD